MKDDSVVLKTSDLMLLFLVVCLMIYWSIASIVFLYRNPTANCMAPLREFKQVVCFERMEVYQTPYD